MTKISLIALTLTATIATATGVSIRLRSNPRCTFANGSTVSGRCMFIDEFTGIILDQTTWRADDNWLGPIAGYAPQLDCIRHENVTVSNGSLQLSITNNPRASCPQTWSTTAYYNATYAASWPTGAATSYDGAIVDQRSFQFKYGRMAMRMKMPAGTGPGIDVSWWGVNCQPGGTIHNYLTGFFAHNGNCQFPQSGAQEFDIPNYTHGQTDGKQIIWTQYVDSTPGSPPLLRSFFGVNYYGADYAQTPLGVNYSPYVTSVDFGDPSTTWHIYETDWRPGQWTSYIDGQIVLQHKADWISTEPKYLMIWIINHIAVNPATLPQTLFIDYVRMWCPPEVPCEWTAG